MKVCSIIITKKKLTLLYCWFAYALAYTLRVNIAVLIPSLKETMGFTNTQLGLVTSLFFITYTIGQLINGYLGDYIQSKYLIIAGLTLSAVLNISISLSYSIVAISVFWALNGYAQSMLWGPIVKTLSIWFDKRQLERVSFLMALSMILGYAVSWGVSSLLAIFFDWRLAFIVPSFIVLIYAGVMLILFKSTPQDMVNDDHPATQIAYSEKPVTFREFSNIINLPCLFIVALTQGMIREGISVWFPTILQESRMFAANSVWRVLIIVPLVNLCGIIFVRSINKRVQGDNNRTLRIIFALSTVVSLVSVMLPSEFIFIIITIIVLLLSMTYGLTPIITTSIPLQHAKHKRVSLTAGMLDFSIYLGAAISGIMSGLIVDNAQWTGIMIMWLVAAIIGLLGTLLLNKKRE